MTLSTLTLSSQLQKACWSLDFALARPSPARRIAQCAVQELKLRKNSSLLYVNFFYFIEQDVDDGTTPDWQGD